MRKAAFAPKGTATEYAEIPIERLIPSPDNPRTHYDEARLAELAASYAGHGVLEPIVVRRWAWPERPLPTTVILDSSSEVAGLYEIAAGHRRHRAARIAGLRTVPCLVRDLSDVAMLEVFGIENAQREDLTPLEEAVAFGNLLDRGGYDVAGIAARIGKGEGYVKARLSVGRLCGLARRAFEAGLVTLSHALLIAPLSAEDQERAAIQTIGQQREGELAVSSGWPYNGVVRPVAELRSWIRTGLTPDLAEAPFDKADATLVPEMGPCETCGFRTVNTLFSGPDDEDRCLKRRCFDLKVERHMERSRASAVDAGIPLVSREYSSAPVGAIPYSKWDEAKSPSERTTRAYVVDGPDKGRTILVQLRPDAAPVGAPADDSERQRIERLARKEQIRLQKTEMLARRRALDAILKAVEEASEEELLRIASARVDVLAAIAAVKIGHGGYSRNVYDTQLPKEMRHPGERSGLAVLGLEGSGRRQDASAFERSFKEILRAFVLSATYDEIFVGDMDPKPRDKEALCLFALCVPFHVDLKALRRAADWDTLSKAQRAEREKAATVKTPRGRAEKPVALEAREDTLVVVYDVLDGLPLDAFVAPDETVVALSALNAVEAFARAREREPARDVSTFRVDGAPMPFVCVGSTWRGDDGWVEADVHPTTLREEWTGDPLDHVTGGVHRGTRFFDVDGAERVVGASARGPMRLITRAEAERILDARVDREAAV